MPRFDKVVPGAGSFRAPLLAAFTGGTNGVDFGKMFAVSLDTSGRVVIGTPNTNAGLAGVIVLNEAHAAGDVIDVMDLGEIVEFKLANGNAAAAGTVYTSNADGTYGTTAAGAANGRIGQTVEAGRLVVRVVKGAKAP